MNMSNKESGLINKNDYLEDIIDDLYEKAIISKELNQESRPTIHVSDLTQECMRKCWYRLNGFQPDKKDFKKALPLVHGTMLHEAVNLGGVEHELSLSANIKFMCPVQAGDGIYSCVYGSLDDIVEIDDELIICDKKTTKKSIPKEVPDNYKIQMNIYKLLYFVKTGISIDKAAIIYIDKSSAWERHKTLIFKLDDVETTREYVLSKLKELDTKEIPKKVITFLCPWCPYYSICKP